MTGNGVQNIQSVLDSAGPQAGRIESLWWVFFWVCTAVFVLVLIALVMAVLRSRNTRNKDGPRLAPLLDPPREGERRMARTVGGAAAVSLLLLIGLLVASVATGRAVLTPPPPGALGIEVVGHQWWWEIKYEDPVPSRNFTTANEIHIPVGRPVRIKTSSADVIHSFWVPNLHGKRDLIPGFTSETWLQADRPGVFRGQCAEFCGYQHANMSLVVVAEPPAAFESWRAAQLQSPPPPATPLLRRGQEVFLALPCPTCHTIAGTPAGGKTAPDLTHLASRRTLAAGTLPNNRGHLAGWILDPQTQKPGNKMPAVALGSDDLQALLGYLESLR
jgi:cytochrome c oxidase subunit 2